MRRVLCLVVLCVVLASAMAYHKGDIVTVLKRSQFNGQRTDWSPLTASECPRFMERKKVKFSVTQEHESYTGYKMAFSFGSNKKHQTAWITIADAEKRLVEIDFVVQFQKNNIRSVTYHSHYVEEKRDHHTASATMTEEDRQLYGDRGAPQVHEHEFDIHFKWEEVVEHDVSFMMSSLYGISIIAALVLAFASLSDSIALV